jgi:hypothetical protein
VSDPAPDARPLPALRIADELERLQPDEMVAIHRDGRVLGRTQRRVRIGLAFGAIGAACAWTIALAPPVGIVYTGLVGAFVAARLRGARKLNAVPRLIRAERLDDAERVIERLDRGGWRQRAMAQYGRMLVAHRRGQLDAALAASERCAQLLTGPDRFLYAVYWMNVMARAMLLLELGRDADAALARVAQAPDGEVFAIAKREVALLRAFVRDRADELGDDDALHARAKDALRYNHTGLTIALLAWAYGRRGDDEMCAHLVAEVAPRCQHGVALLARMHPRVWAWLEPRLEASRDE